MVELDKKSCGQRMRKLQNAFHVTVKYALRGVPADEFPAYFAVEELPEGVLEATYDSYGQASLLETSGFHSLAYLLSRLLV
jgi:hypothetical protein